METSELQKLAVRSRSMREAGVALLIASVALVLFMFIPFVNESAPAGSTTVAFSSTTPDSFDSVQLTAKAAIVYDLSSHEILYAKNADAQLPLASLTKLLTVYAAVKELRRDAIIAIPNDVAGITPPRVFSAGQTFSLTDLSQLTLTASLNDGAAAIATATAAAKSIPQTAMLASAATALGLSQTYAVNGSGLDVSGTVSGGYGSAYDLARLAGALVDAAPDIAAATTKSVAKATSTGGTSFIVKNTDPIIETIPHLLLSKTGYTDLARGNLALVFDTGIKHPVAVVVLGASQESRFTDGAALVAATLAHFANVPSL